MNNLPENSLHFEQLSSFCLMMNKEKVDGNVPRGTFEKAVFVAKNQPLLADTKKFKS